MEDIFLKTPLLIHFNFFPNSGCTLSVSAAHTPVFAVCKKELYPESSNSKTLIIEELYPESSNSKTLIIEPGIIKSFPSEYIGLRITTLTSVTQHNKIVSKHYYTLCL